MFLLDNCNSLCWYFCIQRSNEYDLNDCHLDFCL